MNESQTSSRNMRLKQLLFLITLLVISALVLGSFIRTGIDGFERAAMDDMIDGKAWKPFVYRVFTPTLIRLVTSVLPSFIKDRLDTYSIFAGIRLTEFTVAILLLYLFILGFAWVFMRLARSLYRMETDFLYVATLATVAGLPMFFKIYSHLYDFPQLFLFTACLLLLARRRWGWYLMFFAIAATSKETSILLLLVFILNAKDNMEKRPFYALIAAQVILYAAIKAAITIRFMDNPGSFVEFHLHHNLFMEPYSVGQFAGFVIIGVAIYHHWREKPLFLRRALWIVAPLVFMALFFGNLQEYRVFYEVYPIMALLILHSIAHVVGVKEFEPWNRPSLS